MQAQRQICTCKDCPLKNWPTKEKDIALAFQILFNIVRSNMQKYSDYDKDKKISRALISEWVDKMLEAMSEYYETIEKQRRIFSNIIIAFAKTYKEDGLPRGALNEFIANEKKSSSQKATA